MEIHQDSNFHNDLTLSFQNDRRRVSQVSYTGGDLGHFGSNVFHFLDFYLSVSYYIFLIPFRFGIKNGVYQVHGNVVQQVVSTVLIVIIASHGVLDLRNYFSKGLMETPEKAFMYSYSVLLVVYVLIWFHTFWIKRYRFEKLLRICQKSGSVSVKPRFTWIARLSGVIIFSELKFLWEIANGMYQYGFYGMLQYYGGIGLYNLRIRDSDDPVSDEDMTSNMTIFCALYSIIVSLYNHIEYFLELFALTAAIMFYYCSLQFIDVIKKHTHVDMKLITETYMEYMTIGRSINSICGPAVLIYVAGMIPIFVWCVFGLFEPESGLNFAIFYLLKVIIASSQLVFAAEANAKAQELNKWLLKAKADQLNVSQDSGSNIEINRDLNSFIDFMHREMCNNPSGLRGGKFFTISYGFIGTTMSLVVTYAVVMLQFQVEKYQKGLKIPGKEDNCTCLPFENEYNSTFIISNAY